MKKMLVGVCLMASAIAGMWALQESMMVTPPTVYHMQEEQEGLLHHRP